MNAHTWYNTQGEERKMAHTRGSLNQTTLKASMGVSWARVGGKPLALSAAFAGCTTTFQSGSVKVKATHTATTMPMIILIMRERSSSRCSRNDMRNMLSSSSSPSAEECG